MALADNLVSYWKFNGTSGNAFDNVGGNTLTNNNSTAYTTGKIGSAANLVGASTNYFSISDAAQSGLDLAGSFTISLWFNPQASPSGSEYEFVAKWGSSGGTRQYRVRYDEDSGANHLAIVTTSDGTTGNEYKVTKTLSTSTWYHIVFVNDAGTGHIYVNGSEETTGATGSLNSSLANTSQEFDVGARAAGSAGKVTGYLDELGIWSRALSSGEVSTLYNSGNGNAYPFGEKVITYDATSHAEDNSNTNITWSHPCTGTDLILWVFVMASSARTITSVTYNGVAMTNVNRSTGTQPVAAYYLINPATGANNVSVTIDSTSFVYAVAGSYTGAKQSSQPDGETSNSGNSTSLTGSITTSANNSWGILSVRTNTDGNSSAGSGSFSRQVNAGYLQLYDSNAPKTPAGSLSMSSSFSSQNYEYSMVTFSPNAGTIYTETYSETIAIVDTLIRSASRTLSETITLVDTIIRSAARTLSEVVTAVDTILLERVIPLVLTEIVTLTDTILRSITAVRTETITLVDTMPRAVSKVLSEVVTAVDTFTRTLAIALTLTETITLSDVVTKVLNGSATIWTKTSKSATATWTKTTRAVAATWTKITKSGQ